MMHFNMALILCPDCGQRISDAAPACIYCGRPTSVLPSERIYQNADTPPMPPPPAPPPVIPKVQQYATITPPPIEAIVSSYPLFPVTTAKFLVLSICTLGFYELYWGYKNWQRIQIMTGEKMMPFWRAFWLPLWTFSLFKRINLIADQNSTKRVSVPDLLGSLYLILSLSWKLHNPWSLVSMFTFLPLLPVQMAVARINARHAGLVSEAPNSRYSAVNIITIILGGLLFVFAVIGSFMPEQTPTS
jgi:hypothetical protein